MHISFLIKKRILVAVVLSFICFLLYNANFRLITSGDAVPAKYLPVCIILKNGLHLDDFSELTARPDGYGILPGRGGHLVSMYPIVAPLMSIPIYAVPVLILNSRHSSFKTPRARWVLDCLEKLSASSIAALSVFFFFLVLSEFIPMFWAIGLTIVYGLSTNTWVISSQGLWQHGPAELLLCISLYAAIKLPTIPRYIYLLAISSALSFVNRPINVIITISFLIYVFIINPRLIISYLLLVTVVGILFVAYNLYAFGQPFGGYFQIVQMRSYDPLRLAAFLHPQNPFYLRLPALLFSPSRGLLFFSPILAFGLLGIFRCWKQTVITNKDILIRIFSVSSLFMIIVLSSLFVWWGGCSYGPRYLTDIIPILIFSMANVVSRLKPVALIIFLVFGIWSVLVQLVGAFYYPNGEWDSYPVSVDVAPRRVWNLRDNQIIRSVRFGKASSTLLEQWNVSIASPESLPREGYKVSYDNVSFPAAMRCGRMTLGSLRVTNASKFNWSSRGNNLDLHVVRASYHWRDLVTGSFIIYDGWRTAMPKDLSPGGSVNLKMNIAPPPTPGRYLLEISLVQEGDAWFEDMGAVTLRLLTTVYTE